MTTKLNPRLLLSIATIAATGALAIGAAFAFFTDTETSAGNTFTAGKLDLTVSPNPLVTLEDFKPGDDRLAVKTLNIDFNPAQVWMHIKDLDDDQGTQPEPEVEEENGTPQSNLQDVVTYDLTVQGDPDNVVITFEDETTMTEATSCWIPLGTIPGDTDVTVIQSFHFPPEVTNWAQGDTLSFTEEFYATQVNDPDGPPPTGSGRVWNEETNRCEEAVVDPGEPFVDSVPAVSGTYGHCCSDLASDTATAASLITGAPDSPPDSDFIQISAGSSVTARFDDNKAVDGPGNDIRIHIYDALFPADANIEISADPSCVAGFSAPVVRQDTVDGDIDLATLTPPLAEARCVRITDLGAPDTTFPTLGYDLDAIEALNSVVFP